MTEDEKQYFLRRSINVTNIISNFLRDIADAFEKAGQKKPSWTVLREIADKLEDDFGGFIKKHFED